MPWRWAIPNTSAMARSTSSRLGCAGCPILFIVLFTKLCVFVKKEPDVSDVPAQGVSKFPKRNFELRTIRLCKSCAQSSPIT
jgi:hypothetical protein